MTNIIMAVVILVLGTLLMLINQLAPGTSPYMHFFSLIIQGFALGILVSDFIPS